MDNNSIRSCSERLQSWFDAGVFPDVSGPIFMCGGFESTRCWFVAGLKGLTAVCGGFAGGMIAAVKGPYWVCGW